MCRICGKGFLDYWVIDKISFFYEVVPNLDTHKNRNFKGKLRYIWKKTNCFYPMNVLAGTLQQNDAGANHLLQY